MAREPCPTFLPDAPIVSRSFLNGMGERPGFVSSFFFYVLADGRHVKRD